MIEDEELDPCHQYCYLQKQVGLFEDPETEQLMPCIPILTATIPIELLPTNIKSNTSQIFGSEDYPNDLPYGAIGLVSVKHNTGQRSFGMGTTVGDHHILTCARLIAGETHHAVEIHFISWIIGARGRVCKAASWSIPDEYFNSGVPQAWDIAVIELEERGTSRICGRLARKHKPTRIDYLDTVRVFRLQLTYNREGTRMDWRIARQCQYPPRLLNHSYQLGSPVVNESRDGSFLVGVYVGEQQRIILFEDHIVAALNRLTSRKVGQVTINVKLSIGAVAHLALSNLPSLQSIELPDCQLNDDSMRVLVFGRWQQLEHLNLARNFITDEGALRITRPDWPRLSRINLSSNLFGVEGYEKLVSAQWSELTELNCCQCSAVAPLLSCYFRNFLRTHWRWKNAIIGSLLLSRQEDLLTEAMKVAIRSRVGLDLVRNPPKNRLRPRLRFC